MKILTILSICFALSSCGESTKTKNENHYLERKAAAKERFENGPYIANMKEISPTETLQIVIIPGKIGGSLTDSKCFIYKNTQYKTAQMQCPDTASSDIYE